MDTHEQNIATPLYLAMHNDLCDVAFELYFMTDWQTPNRIQVSVYLQGNHTTYCIIIKDPSIMQWAYIIGTWKHWA